MSMTDNVEKELQLDAANLYREESYTDLRAGSLRKLVPVTADGADDLSRPAILTASTQVMTPGGILPLSGEIDGATNLPEAIAGFNPAIRKALADLREEVAAMQRERASQIVVPGRTAPPPPPDLLIR